jgi:drug/metabolite transporter (DMT)-like permease
VPEQASGGRPLAAAAAGALCVSSSAILMQLGGATASVTALGRCVFALPVLGAMLIWDRKRRGRRPRPIQHRGRRPRPIQHRGRRPRPIQHRGRMALAARSRWIARISGVFLAADLILWSHSIAAIGAGLGTVVPSFQVLFIALLAWLFLGERPRRSLLFASPVMLAGLTLVGGLTGTKAYGADPALGVAEGLGVAVLYSCYILALRSAFRGVQTNPPDPPPATRLAVTDSPGREAPSGPPQPGDREARFARRGGHCGLWRLWLLLVTLGKRSASWLDLGVRW